MMTNEKNDSDVLHFSRSGSPTVTVSNDIDSQSRTNTSRILNALATSGHKGVADVYGKDVSMISKWKDDGQFERIGAMLAVLGLKVVPMAWQVMDVEQVNALITMSRAHMASLTAEKLGTGE
jgi:uncharacterized membrane protein YhfC